MFIIKNSEQIALMKMAGKITAEALLVAKDAIRPGISTKEIEDLDLDITVNYENNQLDVDVDVGILFDELSEISQDQIMKAIDEAYLQFDSYIDENYRE